MDWIDLPKEQQKALARAAVAERRTLIERWRDMGEKVSPGRDERARIAASYIPAGLCVVDVGCGSMMPLERHLPQRTRYVPVDVAPRDDRTVVVDLNVAPLPDLGAHYVVALGLLEYLNDVPGFLRQIPCNAVLSYAPVDQQKPRDRAESGWVNSYTVDAVGGLFEAAGFQIADLRRCPGKQMIWHLLATRGGPLRTPS
jgi:hypothetical protein